MSSFAQQLKSAMTQIRQQADAVAEAVVVGVGESLVDKSPVGVPEMWNMTPPEGYVPGQFKGSWHHSFGGESDDYTSTVDASGASSMREVRHGAAQEPISNHFFTNNLPYAMAMEQGRAIRAMQVQPVAHAMVQLTELEFPQIVKAAVAKVGK